MIAFHFPPSLATGARRPYRLAKYLVRHGYETHVITAVEQGSSSAWHFVMEAPGGTVKRTTKAASKAARICQRYLPYNDELPWVPFAIEAAKTAMCDCRPAAIISSSPPLACHIAAFMIARQCELPWIADFRDPLYGNPSRNRSWGWIWDAPVDRLIMSQAAAVIANTDAAAAALAARYPQYRHKLHLIWNGFDPEEMLGPAGIPPRPERLLLHAGSLYGQRHPTLLLASLDRLIACGSIKARDIRVRFLGDYYETDPWLKEPSLQRLTGMGCVELTAAAVPPSEAAQQMQAAEYLLLLDLNDRGLGLQVPAKLFEYVQIGRPILAFTARNSPVQRILDNACVPHVCVHPDSPADSIDAAILSFLQLPSDPVKPSAWFFEQFDGDKQARSLAAILDSICSNRADVA